MPRRPLVVAVAVLLFAADTLLNARVLSYAPYTDRVAPPAVGLRLSRYFALVEASPSGTFNRGQLVLYDSKGEEEPRVVYPQGGSDAFFYGTAVRQRPEEQPMILAVVSE